MSREFLVCAMPKINAREAYLYKYCQWVCALSGENTLNNTFI